MITRSQLEQWEAEEEQGKAQKAQSKPITLADINQWEEEERQNKNVSSIPENKSQYPSYSSEPYAYAPMGGMVPYAPPGVLGGIAQSFYNAIPGLPEKNISHEIPGSGYGEAVGNLMIGLSPSVAISGVGKALSMIPTLNKLFSGVKKSSDANKLLSGIGQIGRTASEGALGGAMLSPENRLEGAEFGGSLGAGLGSASKLFGAGLNALNPVKSSLSPEELLNNLRVTKGTQTPLGDVIQSPYLKKLTENIIKPIPGSGLESNLQDLGQNIVSRGSQYIEKLRGGIDPVKIPDRILSSLEGLLKESKKVKNNLYTKLDKVAEENNFKPNLKSFMEESKRSRESLDSIKVLENDPELKSLYNKISRYEEPLTPSIEKSSILNKEGKPFTKEIPSHEPSLKEAILLKSTLKSYADAFRSSPDPKDRLASGTLNRLSSSIGRDIKTSIKNAPENLKNMYEKTNQYYKESFLPNLDKEIYRYTMGKGDPDTLVSTLVKPGRNKLSDKLLSKLSDKDKNLIGYSLLQKSIDPETGSVNPKQMRNILKKYSSHQKESIFGKNMSQKFNDYSQLVKLNDEALTQMFNPKTGARVMPFVGMTAPYAAGYSLGGFPGGVAATLGASGLSNVLGRAITSPSIREKVVNSLSKPPELQNRLQELIGAGSSLSAPSVSNIFSRRDNNGS